MGGGLGSIPSLQELSQYNVNRPNAVEAICQSMYDSATYAQAGQVSLQFFQTPQGQSGKTLANTNMTSAGAMPAPQSFLIQAIELYFIPGENPSVQGAHAASAFVNDTFVFWTTPAWLQLFVGSKAYLQEAPLIKFPPMNGLSGFSGQSDATTAAATGFTGTSYATASGPIYEMNPPVLLVPTQNFTITLNWNTAQSITAAATVYCSLRGVLYRNSQ